MKRTILILLCCLPVFIQNPSKVSAVDLKNRTEEFIGKKITIEGKVVHVCPMSGQKLKLIADSNIVIKVLPGKKIKQFDAKWNGKKVAIQGRFQEERITKAQLDALANPYGLCHIDHTPCLDSAWANNRMRKATSTKTEALQEYYKAMEAHGKDYIQILTITARKITEIK